MLAITFFADPSVHLARLVAAVRPGGAVAFQAGFENPRAVMDNEPIAFTKAMEGIGTIPGPTADEKDKTLPVPA